MPHHRFDDVMAATVARSIADRDPVVCRKLCLCLAALHLFPYRTHAACTEDGLTQFDRCALRFRSDEPGRFLLDCLGPDILDELRR